MRVNTAAKGRANAWAQRGAQMALRLIGAEPDDLAQPELLQKWEVELARLAAAIEVLLDHAKVLRRYERAHGRPSTYPDRPAFTAQGRCDLKV